MDKRGTEGQQNQRTAVPCRDCGTPARYADGFCSDACLINHNFTAREYAGALREETA